MALVDDYLDDVEMTKITVEDDKKKILEAIDLNAFMVNPIGLLRLLGNEFITQHLNEIQTSYKSGQSFARKLLNEV